MTIGFSGVGTLLNFSGERSKNTGEISSREKNLTFENRNSPRSLVPGFSISLELLRTSRKTQILVLTVVYFFKVVIVYVVEKLYNVACLCVIL